MNIEFYNCPKPQEFNPGVVAKAPAFVEYVPDFELIRATAEEFRKYKNFLVVGHGGSVSSFYGLYEAFPEMRDRNAYFLSTVDPDYIFKLKQELSPEDTLVVAISKSGETVTQLEALMQFLDYPILAITGKGSTLEQIAKKINAKIVTHPTIGGRFTGMTEVALIPAALVGLDVKSLYDGAKSYYENFKKDNVAFRTASVFYQLEQKGFVDVFMPVYSKNLYGLSYLIVQLCHESFGKDGQGQTYFCHEAPESQHHTNQRFFGGRKNTAAIFLSVDSFNHNLEVNVPTGLHSVPVRGKAFFDLSKIPLGQSMSAELQGTLEDARINSIPCAHLSVTQVNFKEVGALLAFWQLYAVYASILRGVDPYNQPQVENSKIISLNKRLQFKNLVI